MMNCRQPCIQVSALCLCLLSSSASAASLYLQGSPGLGGNNVWSWATVAQGSYSSSLFDSLGPSIDITAISFVAWPNDHFRQGNSWTMTIGAVPNAVANMSNIQTNNLPIADAHFFATESFSTDLFADGSLVTFHGDFTYNPADGDLVWQIQANGPIGGPAFYFGHGSPYGIYWFAEGSSIIQHGANGYRGQLLNTIITVPEASTLSMCSILAGTFGVMWMVRFLKTQQAVESHGMGAFTLSASNMGPSCSTDEFATGSGSAEGCRSVE